MTINIYMKGPYPQSVGALVTITEHDESKHGDMARYCRIDVEEPNALIKAASEHYKSWNGTTVELDVLMEGQQPVVIRDELLYALRTFKFEHLPFTAVYFVHDADKSPFMTHLERRTLDATEV